VYPVNDARPQISAVPIPSVDAPVQLISGDNSSVAPVLPDQQPCHAIDFVVALLHYRPGPGLVGHDLID
jgi:hypothetical protein